MAVNLSNLAMHVLTQLWQHKAVDDEDILSAQGRDELISKGLAIRTVQGYRNRAVTNLTSKGFTIAEGWHSPQWGRA